MRALILAAGWALRMGALVRQRPKALLAVGGRTPLDFVVDAAAAVPGLVGVDVLAHERARPAIEAWAESRRRPHAPPLAVYGNGVARPEERRGAVADLARHLAHAGDDDDLLVLASDLVFDFDLAPLAAVARRHPAVVVYDVGSPERASRYASVEMSPDGRVRRLVEKDPRPPSGLAATALYGLPRASRDDPARYLAGGGMPDNLGFLAEWWVARGRLRGVRAHGRWIDVGCPEDYARALRVFGDAS